MSGSVFGVAYSYGHLLFAAISLTIAFAFAVSAWRISGLRSDLWNAGVYLCSASAGVLEMTNSLSPTVVGARIYFIVFAMLFVVVSAGAYAQYGSLVLSPEARSRYRLVIAMYGSVGLALAVAIGLGWFDGGQIRSNALWGAHGTVIATTVPGAILLGAFCIGNVPLNSKVLLAPGPRSFERRLVAGSMMISPVVVIWELLLSVGVNPYLPVGGYVASLLGLNGALVLIERFRNLAQSNGNLGGYIIERRLGGGGMADVFLAYRESTSEVRGVARRAAVKRLRVEYANDPMFVNMFLDEARVASRLAHPNIVGLYDVGRQDGDLYIAMEVVDGASLAQVFQTLQQRGDRLRTEAVVEVGVQLCDALEYVHGLKDEAGRPLDLVHRDVSPQNVLVDRSGAIKLADFGIARSADRSSQTATGVIKGKFSYMAPEQLRGEPYDHRVDLYALGAILFELAVGRRLRDHVSEDALPFLIVNAPAPPLDALQALPAPVADALRRALSPTVSDRVSSAAELRAALLAFRDQPRGRATLASVVGEACEWSERRQQGSVATQLAVPTRS